MESQVQKIDAGDQAAGCWLDVTCFVLSAYLEKGEKCISPRLDERENTQMQYYLHNANIMVKHSQF